MAKRELELPWCKRFESSEIKTSNGRMIVKTCARGKGGIVEIDSKIGFSRLSTPAMLTPTKARKLADMIYAAADHLDGGIPVEVVDAKCRCGSKKDLKMVQDRGGHYRARLMWGPPHPLCPKCRKKDRGIFRYCPTK